MADVQQQLQDLGNQMAQEETIQADLKNRWDESNARIVKINLELAKLAKEAANPSDGEACPA
jgi:hypothetical protein